MDHCLLFATEGSEADSSSGSSEGEEGEGGEGGEVEWTPSGPQRVLGDWEKHTTVSWSFSLPLNT